MPYVITKNFSDYSVINPISGHIYSKHTTFNRAKKQLEQNLTVSHLPIKGVMGDIPHYFINYK
jgi:hypothetical protein